MNSKIDTSFHEDEVFMGKSVETAEEEARLVLRNRRHTEIFTPNFRSRLREMNTDNWPAGKLNLDDYGSVSSSSPTSPFQLPPLLPSRKVPGRLFSSPWKKPFCLRNSATKRCVDDLAGKVCIQIDQHDGSLRPRKKRKIETISTLLKHGRDLLENEENLLGSHQLVGNLASSQQDLLDLLTYVNTAGNCTQKMPPCCTCVTSGNSATKVRFRGVQSPITSARVNDEQYLCKSILKPRPVCRVEVESLSSDEGDFDSPSSLFPNLFKLIMGTDH